MILKVDRWLAALCDPAGPRPGIAVPDLRGTPLLKLRKRADNHGVLPAVVNNLHTLAPEASIELAASDRLAQMAAVAMFLRVRALELAAEFKKRSIPAVLIKGPVTAASAYRPSSLRTYVDVDLLTPRSAWEDVRAVMRHMGYVPAPTSMKYDADYGEEGWFHRDHPGCSFEVHWNLVNSPTIRRGVSVTYEDLQPNLNGHPLTGMLSPAAMLLIAAVHAAASHAFDKLQHLCDIAQLARNAAGEVNPDELAAKTRATGAILAVVTGLSLAERVLVEPACGQLLQRAKLGHSIRAARLLSPDTVIGGQSRDPGLSLRRRMFRQALKRRRA